MFCNDSGMSPAEMQSLGLAPEECVAPCADRHCRGWKMIGEKERNRSQVPQNEKMQRGAYET